MKPKILKLIDFEKVDTLLEGFKKTTGFLSSIIDLEGNILSRSKSDWRQICIEFHRINPETAKKCRISDTELANKMAEGEKYHFYQCLNGLVDVAVPIVIKGEHIANLFSGQFLIEDPDRGFFKQQAEKYGFDEKKYLEALDKVPVVSKDDVKVAMEFLLSMTLFISEMTLAKLEQTELNIELEERENQYRNLANAGIALIWKSGADKLCNYFNDPWLAFTGRPLEQEMGNGWAEGVHPDDFDRCLETYVTAFDKREPFEMEYQLRHASGEYRVILDLGTPNFNSKGEFVGYIGHCFDITDRKQTQEALQRIEWMLSKKTVAVKSNQAPLYGDLSELNTGRLILDSVGKNVLEDITNDTLRLLETSSAIYEKNGDYAHGIYASNWCRFMDLASHKLCKTDDNTEALKSGKWLCHDCCWEEASLPAIASGQPVDIECQGGIHLFALPIFAGDEVVGAINFGYGDPPQDKKKLSELAEKYKVPLDELLKRAKEYESRPPYIIDTAKDRLQVSANLIGEIVSRKITEKEILTLNEELEQRVSERTAQLEATNKEMEAFTYSVSHDLRAPLRHINGYVDLMNEKFRAHLPEKAQYYLATVTDAARQMGTLIDELLQFSRTGRQELRKTKIEMNVLVQDVLERIKKDMGKRAITWKVQKLPQVLGDDSLLKQVWTNLLENATKFSRNKKLAEISISFAEEEKYYVFCVRDNGVGFNMKYVHKLFGVFQRLHSQSEFEGTGIGLANVQRIVHKHKGKVWAEAEPGKGAVFYFSLPKSL